MKRILLMMLVCLSMHTFTFGKTLVELTTTIIDKNPIGNQTPKSPIQPPTVYIEDYVLTFTENHPDYTLYIKDEDGDVVYTTTVWSSETEVILPSTLSGDYEIELVMGYWLFTGWIEL